MNKETGWWETLSNSGINVSLLLLVVLLGIWLGSSLRNVKPWNSFLRLLAELMAGLLFGLVLGFVLRSHQYAGILCVGGLTVGVMLILNADPQYRIHRLFAVAMTVAMALFIYWLEWGDFNYLLETIMEDFQGGN